jgi:hypothetical protein
MSQVRARAKAEVRQEKRLEDVKEEEERRVEVLVGELVSHPIQLWYLNECMEN